MADPRRNADRASGVGDLGMSDLNQAVELLRNAGWKVSRGMKGTALDQDKCSHERQKGGTTFLPDGSKHIKTVCIECGKWFEEIMAMPAPS